MNKKHIFSIVFVLLITFVGYSQTVVLKQDVNNDTIPKKYGQNRQHYFHTYTGLGWVLGKPENDSLQINYGKSFEFTIGYRYKFRLNNVLALGFDLGLNWRSFNIKQDSSKIFPGYPVVIYKKERLSCANLIGGAYVRINYGKRGNSIGRFIDVGATLDWNYSPKYITQSEYTTVNGVGASRTQQTHSGLVYTNDFNYGFTARAGFNVFVLYASYRMSDIFKSNYIFTELPRFTAGVQISAHK